MPTCSRCGIVFLESETHRCEPTKHRARIFCTLIGVIAAAVYVVIAYQEGGLVNPGAVAIYVALIVGSLMVGVVHLAMVLLHLPGG